MTNLDVNALAGEIAAAYRNKTTLAIPTSRDPQFDMDAAYSVESALADMRRREGRTISGRKVGYANKAMWRVLKIDTLVWARMYDDTVLHSPDNFASLPAGAMVSPKIEPEIVFKLARPVTPGADAAGVLDAVEWLALGFEIIDCVYPGWQFQPADFVAAYGLHAALVVGQPRAVTAESAAELAEQLPKFKLRLLRGGEVVEEGSGRNSLKSPALCLSELASAVERRPGAASLETGELISSGTLTTPQFIKTGEEWSAEVEGMDLPKLVLRVE